MKVNINIELINDTNTEKIIINNNDYNYEQTMEILGGINEGLTFEQIELFSYKKFNIQQIKTIKLAIKNNVDYGKIKLLADENFNYHQMNAILSGFINGMTIEQFHKFINPDYNYSQIDLICSGLGCLKLSDDEVSTYAKSEYNSSQMHAIEHGLSIKLDKEIRDLYTNPKFSAIQMNFIKSCFNGAFKINIEQVAVLANSDFSIEQMKSIFNGLISSKMNLEQVKNYAKVDFPPLKMNCIRKAYDSGLLDEQVNILINGDFDSFQSLTIMRGFLEYLFLEQVLTYAKEDIHWEKMKEIKDELVKENKKDN